MGQLDHAMDSPHRGCAGAIGRVIGEIRQIFSDITKRAALRAEIADLDRRGGLDTVLADIGVTRAELAQMIAGYPVAGRLLPAMARRLGLDIATLDPRSRSALERGCASCRSRRRCRHWLDDPAADSAGYRNFCANMELFERLRANAAGKQTRAA